MTRIKPFDFSQFSDAQLLNLARQVAAEVARRRADEQNFLREHTPLVDEAGPRYRNPRNPVETWLGRGRRPAWIEVALANGWTLEELGGRDDRPVRSRRRGSRDDTD